MSLKRLIDDRILARPVFISTKTDFSFQEALPAEEWKKLESQQFNLEMLDEKWARQIGENASRNKKIVDHYCEDRKKYGPTLVFALNVANAIALNKLFNDRKVRAAVVVGDLRDQTGTHNVSHKKRTEDLERFKNGDLDVLVNVNVFTEGTDLPKVQTVFLTRPTTSKTLVMQMVGRALRGERARGTKDAYIVSFIDDWEDKIEWANPEQLFVDGDTDARERMPETRQQPSHLISIEFLEKLAALFDASLPANSHLQKHSFLERVPIGLYSFSLLDSETGTDRDRTVLVYSGNHREFTEFTNDLPTLLKPYSSGKKVSLSATELDELMNNVRERYFGSADRFPPVSDAELHDMIQFAFVYEAVPELIVFAERDKLDIDAVAKVLFEQELGGQRKMNYLHQVWRDNSAGWQNFFGIGGFEQFVREVNYANTRLETQAAPRGASPNVVPETIDIEEMSLEAIKEQFPQKYLDLRSQVEKTHRSDNGAFVCAKCGRESRVRYSFEIDHRKPRSKRGLTRLDNLQLLCVKCNRRKGAKF